MKVGSLLAIYFVVWWTVLFAILPWGIRTQQEDGEVTPGTAHSAPVRPLLVKKAIATSIVAAVIVGLFWLAVDRYGLNLESIAGLVDLRQ